MKCKGKKLKTSADDDYCIIGQKKIIIFVTSQESLYIFFFTIMISISAYYLTSFLP